VRELGVLRLQRPADERRKATGSALHVAHAEQVLDAIGEGFAEAIHHGDRRPQPEPVRDLITSSQRSRPAFLRATWSRTLCTRISPPPPGIESRPAAISSRMTSSIGMPNRPAKKSTSDGEKAVDVNRVVTLDVAQQIENTTRTDVGVVSALHQNLHAADRFELVDLPADFSNDSRYPRMLGAAIERAELAVGDADVGVVDVSVDDVRDDVVGCSFHRTSSASRPSSSSGARS